MERSLSKMISLEKKNEPFLQKPNFLRKVSVEVVKTPQERMIWLRYVNLFFFVWIVSFFCIFLLFSKIVYLKDLVLKDFMPAKESSKVNEELRDLNNNQTKESLAEDADDMDAVESKLNETLRYVLATTVLNEGKGDEEFLKKPECVPQKNIAFIKTHKTASSTVTNILNRYADLRELTVALPAMGDIRFTWPRKFHWSNVDMMRLDGQPANILANHARYHRDQMNMIMEEDSKYITILRHPVSQFESSFYYFEFDKLLRLKNVSNPIEVFLAYPDEYLYNLTLLLGDLPETMNLMQSGMIYDLGYDFMDLEPDDAIENILKKLEKEFAFVMIMEYFDESLVLMKNEFCWQFDDILYIKQNQRLKKINLTEGIKQRIMRWNHADMMLYEHFNKTFWKKIATYGERFWSEVKEFKQRNSDFEKTCAPQRVTTKGYKINVDVSGFIMNPKVDRYNRYLCEKVLMTEVDYLSYFRKKFGVNFGYQRILVAEGMKPLKRRNRLNERLKIFARTSPRKFRLSLKGGGPEKRNRTPRSKIFIPIKK